MTYKPFPINGPWKGVVSDIAPVLAPQALEVCSNWLPWKGRIQTRPKLSNIFQAINYGRVLAMVTFQDASGGIETLLLTDRKALHWTGGADVNGLNMPSGATFANLSGTGLPYGVISTQNKVIFCNGSVPLLYDDGEQDLKVAGDVPGSAYFITEQASHIILANTVEPALSDVGAVNYPQRVRWSKSGDPTVWLTDFTAGFADLLDVPDTITGVVSPGPVTYVLRTNGITSMYPTGNGMAPFSFEHLSYGEVGAGCLYPYATATYGGKSFFIGADDIYSISQEGLDRIGSGSMALKAIFADIAQASPDFPITGNVLPNLGNLFDMPSYWINLPSLSVSWVYATKLKEWFKFSWAMGDILFTARVAVGG